MPKDLFRPCVDPTFSWATTEEEKALALEARCPHGHPKQSGHAITEVATDLVKTGLLQETLSADKTQKAKKTNIGRNPGICNS